MANDIDKTSPHYKGEFGSIYEVNQKFPSGGVQGDYVAIDGWAHYWNADRGTWCVNAQRDSYWDELITNIIEKFKLVRGATYMGVASLDTVPAKVVGAKMYYFATVAGTYKNFGDLVVPQGINVLYSENGSSWVNTTLLEVAQELGVSTKKVVSQKALNDALNLKANQSSVNEALAKKFDKTSVAQDSGDSEQLVMSQKAVTNKLSDLVKLMFNGNPDDVNFVGLGRGSSNFPYIVFSKPNEKTEYMIWQQGGKFIANKRTVNDDNTGWNQWERIRLDDSYILNFSICASNQNFGISDFIVSNAAKSSIIDISIYEEFAKGKDFILQKYGISDTDMYLFVQEVSNIEDKDSVIAFDVNKSFMANIKNVTSDNYKGLVKIKLQKNQNDTTEVGYVTIDVDLVKKHKFYATNNLTYNNAHIVPRLIHKELLLSERELFNGNPDDVNFVGLGRGSSNFPYIVFSKPNEKTEYMIWQQGGKFIANKRTVNDDNTGWNQWERIRLDDSYILNFSICASNQNFGISDFIVSNAAKSSIIDISIYEEFAKGKDFILQKYGISDTDMYLFVQEVSNIEDKDSVIAFDVNKSFMANIKNVTSDNYKGLVKIKLQKNQNDTTEVGYVTIDVDLVKKHKFYATNNLTYNNAHIVPRLIHKDVEVTPKMFVKKEASKGLNVYCKLKDNLFIQYPLVYREKDADGLGETSEHIFYHNYGLFPLKLCSVKSISDVTIMYDIFREAEIEVAIAVNNSLGHFYFVGGYFHGFEDIVNYDNENRNVQILIDDKKIEEDEEYIGECKKIKVYQKSILYNSNAGKTDEIALLDKLWEFNDGKFTLDCTITISQDRTILRGFGNMFPVFRHNKGKSSEPYLTNKQIKDNNIYVVNDQSDGWDTGITSKLDFNCKSIIQYGELGFGFSVEQSDKNIIDKTGGMYTITNGSSYNKTYTAFAENKAVKKGDVFRIRNDWNFSYTK